MPLVDLLPMGMKHDVRKIVLKFGSPDLVRALLFDQMCCSEQKNQLTWILGVLSSGPMGNDGQPTAETFWIENMMDYLYFHVRVPGEEPWARDNYKPDMQRPDGMDALLDRASYDSNTPSDMEQFWDGDAQRPPKRLVELAPQFPGGWVLEVDVPTEPDKPVAAERVRGAWKVLDDGRISTFFQPNPDYRPQGVETTPSGKTASQLDFSRPNGSAQT